MQLLPCAAQGSGTTGVRVKRAYEWRCAVWAGNIAVRLHVVSA